MHIYFLILFFIFSTNSVYCQHNYLNYKLYNVVPVERFQLKFLQSLENQKYINVVFWSRPFKLYNDVQILVGPDDCEIFKERLRHFNINGTLLSDNILGQFERQKVRKYTRLKLDTFSWDAYHDLQGVYQWMTDITKIYSEKSTLRAIGRSLEGREILAIEVKNQNAKTVIVEGGLHGNEWITAEFVTYLTYQLLNAEKTLNSKLQQVTKKYRWMLIPVVNPDGYDHSMKVDRLWRKNRRNLGNETFGVNLNRNFDYNFCKHDSSVNPKHDYYCGPQAFSEPETKVLSEFVNLNKESLKFYFSIHAYGQKIIIPYSDRVKHIENFSEMENYGKQAALKMYRLHGVKYRVGTVYDVDGLLLDVDLNSLYNVTGSKAKWYAENVKLIKNITIMEFVQTWISGFRASGDSISWVKKTHKLKHVMSFYLRDNGTFGHALPADQILPACREALVGLVEVMTARHRHVGRELFSRAEITRSSSPIILSIIILCQYAI